MTQAIDVIAAAVGQSARTDQASQEALLGLTTTTPAVDPFDEGDGRSWQYWLFTDDGLELIYADDVVQQVTVYVQPNAEEGHDAFSGRLFDQIPNTASEAEVVGALGKPSVEGAWNGRWIRYDGVQGKNLRFEFDDAGRAATVTVMVPQN